MSAKKYTAQEILDGIVEHFNKFGLTLPDVVIKTTIEAYGSVRQDQGLEEAAGAVERLTLYDDAPIVPKMGVNRYRPGAEKRVAGAIRMLKKGGEA